jgi:hypothetical protein
MFSITGNFITGCMVGFEYVNEKELFEDEEDATEAHLVIDFFIVRLIISWEIL